MDEREKTAWLYALAVCIVVEPPDSEYFGGFVSWRAAIKRRQF